jgi:hypothetical protein
MICQRIIEMIMKTVPRTNEELEKMELSCIADRNLK